MSDSLAPALENGLGIIELVCASDRAVRFGRIMRELGIPKASAVRLLKVLQRRGYVVKDASGGGYLAGPRVASLGRPGLETESLRRAAGVVLKELSEQSGNTALAIHWNGRQMQCLSKVMHPSSSPMQEVGTIMLDLDGTPWGWLFYETLDELSRERAHGEMHDATAFRRKQRARIGHYETKGFAYDDQQVFKALRRLTAPIRNASGILVGAVGIGGNPITIPDRRVDAIGRMVMRAAHGLSRAMGWEKGK
jgi:IclR family acetate operon transcriptional repressor